MSVRVAAVWVLESMVDGHDCCDGCKSMLLLVPPSRLVGPDEHEQEQVYTRPRTIRTIIKQMAPHHAHPCPRHSITQPRCRYIFPPSAPHPTTHLLPTNPHTYRLPHPPSQHAARSTPPPPSLPRPNRLAHDASPRRGRQRARSRPDKSFPRRVVIGRRVWLSWVGCVGVAVVEWGGWVFEARCPDRRGGCFGVMGTEGVGRCWRGVLMMVWCGTGDGCAGARVEG